MKLERGRKTGHFKKRNFSRGFFVPISTLQNPYKAPIIVRLPLAVEVQDEREDLYKRVKKLIIRLEVMIYSRKIKKEIKIKAIKALAELVAKATGILRDYEVEELERETEELKKEARQTPEGTQPTKRGH